MADGTASRTARRPFLDLLFDLRAIIAVLFAFYGLVCLVQGLAFTDAEDLRKTGGVQLNTWAGLGMLATAAAFIAWVLLRPLQPNRPPEPTGSGADAADHPPQQ